MADYGMLGGLAEGMKQGLMAYRDERKYRDELKERARKKEQEEKVYQLGLLTSGYQETDGGFERTPEGAEELALKRRLQKAQESKIAAEIYDLTGTMPEGMAGSAAGTGQPEAQAPGTEPPATGLVAPQGGLLPKRQRLLNQQTGSLNAGLLDKGKRAVIDPMTGETRFEDIPLTGRAKEEYDTKRTDQIVGLQKKQADLIKANTEAEEKLRERDTGKKLSSTDVLKVQEGAAVPAMLADIKGVIAQNKDAFGPVAGRIGGMNPYDEKAQTIQSKTKATSQAFGRYMEGGVLRREDEIKYEKMFPQLGDHPSVAANKLAIVERLLVRKLQSDVQALKTGGFNVAPFQQYLEAPIPEDPAVLGGAAPKPTPLPPPGPKPGTVEGGFRFKGGDPADSKNWEKVK